MKVLHIGKLGVMEKFSAKDSLLYSVERVEAANGTPVEEILKIGADADFIIADAMAKVPAELIEAMPNLKLIHSEGVGYNYFDVEAAKKRGIYVCNNIGMNAQAVAEMAVLLMNALVKDMINGDRAVREGRQIDVKEGYMKRGDLQELSELAVGLVGFGNIAQKTALLLKAFGVATIYYNKRTPVSPEEEAFYGVTYLPLNELLTSSDVVSLHVPVTPKTERMANEEFFASMKDGSYFINTSRGELVDDAALIHALKTGKVRMAGIDTLDNEPVRSDHPMINLPEDIASKIIFSPHIGGITAPSFRRGYQMIWDDIALVMEGKEPNHIV